jgi:hypothetical protein
MFRAPVGDGLASTRGAGRCLNLNQRHRSPRAFRLRNDSVARSPVQRKLGMADRHHPRCPVARMTPSPGMQARREPRASLDLVELRAVSLTPLAPDSGATVTDRIA